MTQTLVDQIDCRELARRVRWHPFGDGPTRKLVRSWIQHDPPQQQIPWTPLVKPLGACRVALVSSVGIARHDQPSFDQELERRDPWRSDQSWRPISAATSEADVGIYYLHIDPHFGQQDLDCVLPLRRLQELSADGLVGQVAATHYSFMGYILQPPAAAGRHRPGHRGPDGRGGGGGGGAGAGVTDLLLVGRTGPPSHRSPGHRDGGVVDDSRVHRLGRRPRVAGIKYPFGRPLGPPDDRAGQRAVLEAAMEVLVAARMPGTVIQLPFRWPKDPREAGGDPPVPPPIVQLHKRKPWLALRLLAHNIPEPRQVATI